MKARFWILAAVLGGVTIFLWGFLVHMGFSPLWAMSMKPLPNESAVVDALKSANTPNGMYYGMSGIFMTVFADPGNARAGEMMGSQLFIEFISNVLEALLLAWLLVRVNLFGVGKRALFAAGVGLVAWVAINVSYWDWYHFPFGYILLEALEVVGGTFLAGLVIAWLLKKHAKTDMNNKNVKHAAA